MPVPTNDRCEIAEIDVVGVVRRRVVSLAIIAEEVIARHGGMRRQQRCCRCGNEQEVSLHGACPHLPEHSFRGEHVWYMSQLRLRRGYSMLISWQFKGPGEDSASADSPRAGGMTGESRSLGYARHPAPVGSNAARIHSS